MALFTSAIAAGRTDAQLMRDPQFRGLLAKYPDYVNRARDAFVTPSARPGIYVLFCYSSKPAQGEMDCCAVGLDEDDSYDAALIDANQHWLGYNGQRTVIFNSYNDLVKIPQDLLRRICSRVPCTVPLRTHSTPFKATRIHINASTLPPTWYETMDHFPESIDECHHHYLEPHPNRGPARRLRHVYTRPEGAFYPLQRMAMDISNGVRYYGDSSDRGRRGEIYDPQEPRRNMFITVHHPIGQRPRTPDPDSDAEGVPGTPQPRVEYAPFDPDVDVTLTELLM